MAKYSGVAGTISLLHGEDELGGNCYLWEVAAAADLRPAGTFGDGGYRSTVKGEQSWDLTATCMADATDADFIEGDLYVVDATDDAAGKRIAGSFRLQSTRHTTDRRGDAMTVATLLSEGKIIIEPVATPTPTPP